MPHHRSRKRNKSSPLVQSSPKKQKPHQTDSGSDLDSIQDITEAEGSTDSEPESDTGSATLLKTPATVPPTVSTEASTMQASDLVHLSQAASGSGSIPDINQPPMLNPALFSSQINPQQPQQLLAFHSPLQHPATCMPGISEQDLVRVAHLVKSLLHEEIDLIVESRVNSATEPFKKELADMKVKYDKLQDEVNSLQVKHDDIEQYSRRMCLSISGIPEEENEDVNKLVLDFAIRVNANVGPTDIDRAHRVGKSGPTNEGNEHDGRNVHFSRKREIIIKFTNSSARLSLLKGRAKLREDNVKNIFINEDLTPTRKNLAYECRLVKRLQTSKVNKTWVYAGYPHILDNTGKKVKITCLSDLDPYRAPEGEQSS